MRARGAWRVAGFGRGLVLKYYAMNIMTRAAFSNTGYHVSWAYIIKAMSEPRKPRNWYGCSLQCVIDLWSVIEDSQTRRMSPLFYTVLFLSAFAACEACSCMESHPQETFCRSHFGKWYIKLQSWRVLRVVLQALDKLFYLKTENNLCISW